MASATYYLKYRPQKVSELDLISVRESLEKILKSKKIPHAFLFSGPKGIGKTSAARIFAKSINCPGKRKDFEPCNKCDVCQEITNGSSLDLIEIDAASNRGIDDIRSLREKIKLSPARCRYKVYIIDEAHMLTTEAFNALLKTLEEPPAHAVFILCTTEPEKLPKTIVSRCLQIKFQKAKKEEVINSLKRVVKGEKLEVEKEVLAEISVNAEGSFRDAQKILDQLSLANRKISLKEAKKLLGKIEELQPDKLLLALAEKNIKTALLEIDRVVNFGADLEVYTQGLLENLRWLLLNKAGLTVLEMEEETLLKEMESKFDKVDLLRLINLFSRATLEIKTSQIAQLPLELAVIEWNEMSHGSDSGSTSLQTQASRQSRDTVSPANQRADLMKTSSHADPPHAGIKDEASQNLSGPLHSNSKGKSLNEILEKWGDLLAGVRPLNHSVEALLRAARPIKLDGSNLTLEVFYKFHKERLETEKCRLIIEEVASQLLGLPVKLKCILGEKKNSFIEDKVEEVQEVENDILDVANKIFNGKIVD
jgi:DNA polymerase-3 subunit gamma/tau